MLIIGLTGSIGMGKSQTAKLFEQEGLPVYDADAAVHTIYQKNGSAVEPIRMLFPRAIIDNAVDREVLARLVLKDKEKLRALEAIVHPLVAQVQQEFLSHCRTANHPMVVLDIPLLYEFGGDERVDAAVVVSAPYEVQRARVLARDGMSDEKFQDILKKQLPDAEKRKRADFIVDSSVSVEDAHRQVRQIIEKLKTWDKTGQDKRGKDETA